MTRAVFAVRKCQQPFVAPAAHRQLHPHQRDAQPRLCPDRVAAARRARRARAARSRSPPGGGSVRPGPSAGGRRVGRGRPARAGTRRPRRAAHASVVTSPTSSGGVRGVELQLPGQREVGVPALFAEQAQTVSAVLEGQRERRLRPRLACRTAQHLDEPDALVVVGQALAARCRCGGRPRTVGRRQARPAVGRCAGASRAGRLRTGRPAPPRPPGRG